MAPGAETIRVIARFRPINERERIEASAASEELEIDVSDGQRVKVFRTKNPGSTAIPDHLFSLDKAFPSDCTQEAVYQEFSSTINDVLQGFNGTIFAYGQTGSGKTHSMFGDVKSEHGRGIIPRAAAHIFEAITRNREKKGTEFDIKCSFIEIYMEHVRDLLSPQNTNLKIRESKLRGVYVENLTEESVTCEADILGVIAMGERFRSVAATQMNQTSSRSHSLLMVTIHQKEASGGTKTGVLNMADLAGSEKIGKTGAKGETLEEAKKINSSLSALGNCIHALTERGRAHIPYRDSKLTFILRESLGGNAKTTLLVACSPHIFNLEETLSTLRFAVRAKTIQVHAVVNKQLSASQLNKIISELKDEISQLRAEASRLEKQVRLTAAARRADPDSIPQLPVTPSTPSGERPFSPSSADSPGDGFVRRARAATMIGYDPTQLAEAELELQKLREKQELQLEQANEDIATLERDLEQAEKSAVEATAELERTQINTLAYLEDASLVTSENDALTVLNDAAELGHETMTDRLKREIELEQQKAAALLQTLENIASVAPNETLQKVIETQAKIREQQTKRARLQSELRAAVNQESEVGDRITRLHQSAIDAVRQAETANEQQTAQRRALIAVEDDCARLQFQIDELKAEQQRETYGSSAVGRFTALRRGGRPPSLVSLIDPDKQGYLHRQRIKFVWRRFWFALKGSYMYFFADPEDINAAGIVHLAGGRVRTREDGFEFEIVDAEGSTEVLASDSEEARQDWVTALKQAAGGVADDTAASAEDPVLRDLRGEVSCMVAANDAKCLYVGTSQGHIVRYDVDIEEGTSLATFTSATSKSIGSDPITHMLVHPTMPRVLVLSKGVVFVLHSTTLELVRHIYESTSIRYMCWDSNDEDLQQPCFCLACGDELRMYKFFSDNAIERYHSHTLSGLILFVLWCSPVMFVGTNEAYYHINDRGVPNMLLPIKVMLPSGARLGAGRVALTGPRNTLFVVTVDGDVDTSLGAVAWSNAPSAIAATSDGRVYALLPDGVEMYDLKRGGFIKERTVKNASFIATAGTRIFAATQQDVCLVNAENFSEELRRPGIKSPAEPHIRDPLQVVPKHEWVPDAACDQCMLCKREFAFFRRKHHCRQCGWVICADCSKQNFKVSDSTEPVRVCDRCAPLFEAQSKR
eukprot:TRINITY_DN7554_c0_g1_i1.p1 TRINITY_DN7554_c0_g1~~TRINITY_DN7554_c0_g1_i1.p1  ORF type:complete len:1164 (-),score=249.02 TRINITY_DN7554_c0_g1_i1:63-3554(-)